MLHRRTSADTAPLEVVVHRCLRMVRSACDEAPVLDGTPAVVVVTFDSQVAHRFADIAFEYEREGLVEARGPPAVR